MWEAPQGMCRPLPYRRTDSSKFDKSECDRVEKKFPGATAKVKPVIWGSEDGTLAKHQMKDKNGRIWLYVTDNGRESVAGWKTFISGYMEYEEAYLVNADSAQTGTYTRSELKEGRITGRLAERGFKASYELLSQPQGIIC